MDAAHPRGSAPHHGAVFPIRGRSRAAQEPAAPPGCLAGIAANALGRAGDRRPGARRFPPLGPAPGLHVLGEVPDSALPALYSGAVALVYPSEYEGFGLPVIEAMQCGACVLATRAVAEAAGDAAIFFSGAAQLAEAMRRALDCPEWLAEFRARSLARAGEFSWERTARLTHEVYAEARRRFAA